MMHIRYKLDHSNHHGIGLFTDQDIAEGDLIYTASPLLDVNITEDQFASLSPEEQKEITWWGYFDRNTNLWHVDFDVSKFINHAKEANITQKPDKQEAYIVALRDIVRGEELTQNYLEFESEAELQQRGISLT